MKVPGTDTVEVRDASLRIRTFYIDVVVPTVPTHRDDRDASDRGNAGNGAETGEQFLLKGQALNHWDLETPSVRI